MHLQYDFKKCIDYELCKMKIIIPHNLYYYGARYYDPRTSVWLGVDPLSDKYPCWA